jgi:proteasome assembly chaperone (PAC2) family protein
MAGASGNISITFTLSSKREFMFLNLMSENSRDLIDAQRTKEVLEKFERGRILEVYFSRLDGRLPTNIPSDHHELYQLQLNDMKNYLLGHHPQDTLMQKIFRMFT